MGKKFNVTGTCIPEKHYMVDINNKLEQISQMVEAGEYFTINRPRQYGKTTTMFLLEKKLQNDYLVIRTSFEGIGDTIFDNEEEFSSRILDIFARELELVDKEYAGYLSSIGKGLVNTHFIGSFHTIYPASISLLQLLYHSAACRWIYLQYQATGRTHQARIWQFYSFLPQIPMLWI